MDIMVGSYKNEGLSPTTDVGNSLHLAVNRESPCKKRFQATFFSYFFSPIIHICHSNKPDLGLWAQSNQR